MADPEALTTRTLELLDIASVTGDESAIADRIAADHASDPVTRVGNSVVVGEPTGRPIVALVGHLDTVPATDDDLAPRVEGGVIVGRGASDMKGGIAVAERLRADLGDHTPYDLVLVLYAAEEGPDEHNELRTVLAEVPWLHELALAIILEPTDLEVQAGCLGGLHALLLFTGRAAHSARPWTGENALTKAGSLLTDLHERPAREVVIDGVTYHDVLTATQASTDNARNVVPDRFVVNLNYRFAPSRDLETAEAELLATIDDRAEVEIVDRAAPAPPRTSDPLIAAFVRDVGGGDVTGKQAWTDIARFAEIDVPAVNYGPGLTSQAHQRGEHVPIANLATAYERIRAFLSADPPAP
jgi:succinyl-diaminopimelate desuccinylase